MSDLDVPAAVTAAAPASPARTAPKSVRIAVWLWVPLVIAQTALLAYAVVGIAIASTTGPGAILIIYLLPASLLIAVLVLSEVLLLRRLRRGSRIARGWLLGLAILSAVIAVWQVLATMTSGVGMLGPGTEWLTIAMTAITVVVGTLSFVGAVLPFRPPAKDFFARRPAGDRA